MAAKKKDARSWMREQLGKKTADALLNKLNEMATKGTPNSVIEKMIAEDLSKHIQKVEHDKIIWQFVNQKRPK